MAVKMFNFPNAFILQVARSVALKHRQLSVQTCCCSFLPRHGESSVKRSSTLPLCFLNAAFFPERFWEVFAIWKRIEKLASGVLKDQTEISSKVRVWGYCPSLWADWGWAWVTLWNYFVITKSLGHSLALAWGAWQWGLTGRAAHGIWESWLNCIPSQWTSPASFLGKCFKTSWGKLLWDSEVLPVLALCQPHCSLWCCACPCHTRGKRFSPCKEDNVFASKALLLWTCRYRLNFPLVNLRCVQLNTETWKHFRPEHPASQQEPTPVPTWVSLRFSRVLRSRHRERVGGLGINDPYWPLLTLPVGEIPGSLRWLGIAAVKQEPQVWFVLAAFAM